MAAHRARHVAAYILEQQGPALDGGVLQKLVYYCQAWSVVWDGKPLFDDRIEAWQDGPVCYDVWKAHQEGALVPGVALPLDARATIDAVVSFYGQRPAGWLRELSQREHPWRNARKGLAPDEKSDREITVEAMRLYYSRLGIPPRAFPPALPAGLDTLVDTPEDAPPPSQDRSVDATGFLEWLRTGEGDPWASSGG